MKKILLLTFTLSMLLSCSNEFNAVYKNADYMYKYEYAKKCYASGKYNNAQTLLGDVVTLLKGTEYAEESLFMYGMALYQNLDYEMAAETFKKYCTSYPKGKYTEQAFFYTAESLYDSSPEPRLDQTPTMSAIKAYQQFMDIYPSSSMSETAHERLVTLQDKLVTKELYNARLYYNLGTYFGNCLTGGSNYEACIITAENAIKEYPYMNRREDFAILIMKSKYYLAQNSVEEKRQERFQNAEDECYGFINEYPDSPNRKLAEDYIKVCKRYTGSSDNS